MLLYFTLFTLLQITCVAYVTFLLKIHCKIHVIVIISIIIFFSMVPGTSSIKSDIPRKSLKGMCHYVLYLFQDHHHHHHHQRQQQLLLY